MFCRPVTRWAKWAHQYIDIPFGTRWGLGRELVNRLADIEDSAPLAKITRPSLQGIFPRTRLFDALDEGRKGAAIWISGPAGSGKTTLTASYLEHRRLPHVWFRMDEADADVATFFYYMGLASKAAAPTARKPLPLLTAEYVPGLPAFARRYFRNLYGRLKKPFVLVFDNYQALPDACAVHAVVRVAVEEMPTSGCAIFISRHPPHQELMTFLVGRTMSVLDRHTLFLTLAETASILTSWGHPELLPADVRLMHERTQGWIAALVLLQDRLPSARQRLATIGMSSQEAIFSYFAEEVLRKMPSPVQDFLLKTALFPEMSADMARRLTGVEEAGDILRDLNRRNYFTERHRVRIDIYGYHSLFREFLLSQAPTRLGGSQFTQAQVDAAEVLSSVGQVEAAFNLFRESGRLERMAELIHANAPALLAQGRHITLETWFQALPEDVLIGSPDLLFWRGVNQLPINPAASRSFLERSFERYKDANNRIGVLLSLSAIVDTFLYEWGDVRPLDRWISELDQVLGDFSDWTSPQMEARVGTGIFLALWSRQPEHPHIRVWERRLEELIFKVEDTDQKVMIGARLAQYCTMTGEFAKGQRLLNSLRSSVKTRDVSPLSMATWWFVKAIYGWLSATYEECAECVDQGLQVSRETGVHVCDYLLLSQRVYGSLSESKTDEAERALERVAELLVESRFLDAALYHYLYSWNAALCGNAPKALEHLKTSLRNVLDAGVPFVEGLVRVAMAQMYQEFGTHREASSELRRASKIAKGMGSSHLEYMCLTAAAHCELEEGNEKKALVALRQAFEIGRKNDYVNFPWWRPSAMARLCAKAIESGIEVDYARNLARRRGLRPEMGAAGQASWPWPVKVFTLGQFKVFLEDQELRFSRKAKEKPLQLLKALIALGGDQVPETRLADLLWPDSEGDTAQHTLGITLYRLRKMLGRRSAIKRVARTLTIVRDECWVDVWEFQRLLTSAEEARAAANRDAYRELIQQAIDIYRGPFFPSDVDEPWARPVQEQARQRFITSACALGADWEGHREWTRAEAVYQGALTKEPLAEPLWRSLTGQYVRRGLSAEARRTYAKCRETFAAELGAHPAFRLEDLANAAHA